MKRDFLSLQDLTGGEIVELLDLADTLKDKLRAGETHRLLEGQVLALIFEKPSTRTRVSFEVGIFQLGGLALNLLPGQIQMGGRETVEDVARTLSRYVNGIMIRSFGQERVEALAKASTVPVINGLTDTFHPCQVLADLQTIRERFGHLDEIKLAYIGDSNNMTNTLLIAASKLNFAMTVASPAGYQVNPEIRQLIQTNQQGFAQPAEIKYYDDPVQAVKSASVIYTDTWTSMGQEEEAIVRKQAFKNYQVNSELVRNAAVDYIFMHCLPAHRGEEVTDTIMDDPAHSVIFDQAENRLHAQKAVMVRLMQR